MPPAILLIDDDPDFLAIHREVLEQAGFAVTTARDGQEGQACLARQKPDLIVLDVMMTTITEGLDLARRLKNHPDWRDIPILLLTGMTKTPQFPREFAGITDQDWAAAAMLDKPVRPATLVREVKRLLGL